MAEDIVPKLRREGKDAFHKHYSLGMHKICSDAVDEIDRLRELSSEGDARLYHERTINKDLYEALKRLVADVDEYERVNNLHPNPGRDECWQSMSDARAALAKAEGKSHES